MGTKKVKYCLVCDYCGRSQDDLPDLYMVPGIQNDGAICEECIERAASAIHAERAKLHATEAPESDAPIEGTTGGVLSEPSSPDEPP